MHSDVMFKLFTVMALSIIVDKLTGKDVPEKDVDEFHHMLGGISQQLAQDTFGVIAPEKQDAFIKDLADLVTGKTKA